MKSTQPLLISPDLPVFQTSISKPMHVWLTMKLKVWLHLQNMPSGYCYFTEVHIAVKTTQLLLQHKDINWQNGKNQTKTQTKKQPNQNRKPTKNTKTFLPSFSHWLLIHIPSLFMPAQKPMQVLTGLAGSNLHSLPGSFRAGLQLCVSGENG